MFEKYQCCKVCLQLPIILSVNELSMSKIACLSAPYLSQEKLKTANSDTDTDTCTRATTKSNGSNDLRKLFVLRKCEVSVERISVCNVTEKLEEHVIHCLPCSYTNVVINMLP